MGQRAVSLWLPVTETEARAETSPDEELITKGEALSCPELILSWKPHQLGLVQVASARLHAETHSKT